MEARRISAADNVLQNRAECLNNIEDQGIGQPTMIYNFIYSNHVWTSLVWIRASSSWKKSSPEGNNIYFIRCTWLAKIPIQSLGYIHALQLRKSNLNKGINTPCLWWKMWTTIHWTISLSSIHRSTRFYGHDTTWDDILHVYQPDAVLE